MTSRAIRRPPLQSRTLGGTFPARLRELAEAGATGKPLTAVEVREVCEALRRQSPKVPTRFHSGAAL